MNVAMLKKAVAIAGLLLGVFLAADDVSAQNLGNPGILPLNSNAFGRSYGEWSAAWWQWLLSIPNATNPNLATGTVDCTLGQTGHVWFLAGTFGGLPVTRDCTIPTGKALFFSPLNGVFGDGVGDCDRNDPNNPCDINKLRELAADNVDDPELLEVIIDNVPVKNIQQYRVASPVFSAVFLQVDPLFGLPPGLHTPLVSDGYWLLLAPLSRGAHTIRIRGVASPSAGGFVVDVTYHLTVTK
jgi:hypothetical protein